MRSSWLSLMTEYWRSSEDRAYGDVSEKINRVSDLQDDLSIFVRYLRWLSVLIRQMMVKMIWRRWKRYSWLSLLTMWQIWREVSLVSFSSFKICSSSWKSSLKSERRLRVASVSINDEKEQEEICTWNMLLFRDTSRLCIFGEREHNTVRIGYFWYSKSNKIRVHIRILSRNSYHYYDDHRS